MTPTPDPSMLTGTNDRFTSLTGLLTREAELLHTLVFKLTEAELLVNAEQTRFLGLIIDEIETAATDVGSIELARGLMVADIAESLGFACDDLPLSELTSHAPEQIRSTLDAVRERLNLETERLESVAGRGRDAIGRRLESLELLMDRLDESDGRRAYDRQGLQVAAVAPHPARIDRPL